MRALPLSFIILALLVHVAFGIQDAAPSATKRLGRTKEDSPHLHDQSPLLLPSCKDKSHTVRLYTVYRMSSDMWNTACKSATAALLLECRKPSERLLSDWCCVIVSCGIRSCAEEYVLTCRKLVSWITCLYAAFSYQAYHAC